MLAFGSVILWKTSELSPSESINLLERILPLIGPYCLCALALFHYRHVLHFLQCILERITRDISRTRIPRPLIIGLYTVVAISIAKVVLFEL